MTTSEITLALEDIAIVDFNDIVDVMLYLGYSIVTNEIKGIEWGMTARTN